MTITEEMVLAGAKAAARENGDDFDLIPKDKPDWLDKRGQFQGRYRDLNEPKQNDYIEMSRAALTAALADCVVGWLPIETAPRDGTFIILYCPEDGSRWWASWQGGWSWFGSDEYGLRREGHSLGNPNVVTGWFVSHWQPLPAPPAP